MNGLFKTKKTYLIFVIYLFLIAILMVYYTVESYKKRSSAEIDFLKIEISRLHSEKDSSVHKLNKYIEKNIKIDTIFIENAKADSIKKENIKIIKRYNEIRKRYIDLLRKSDFQDSSVFFQDKKLISKLDSLEEQLTNKQELLTKGENENRLDIGLIIFLTILSIPSFLLILKIVEYIPSKEKVGYTYEAETEKSIEDNFHIIKQRLYNEIDKNYEEANLHFLIAFLIAWFLISFIGYFFIFSFNSIFPEFDNWVDFMVLYLPRLLVIIGFGTLFLYYMKSYKGKLIDIKYYQNEITNIEFKLMALKTAIGKDNKGLEKIIISFVETERNYKLNMNETTKEIEQLKIENEINSKYLNKLWSVLDYFKSNENRDKKDKK